MVASTTQEVPKHKDKGEKEVEKVQIVAETQNNYKGIRDLKSASNKIQELNLQCKQRNVDIS